MTKNLIGTLCSICFALLVTADSVKAADDANPNILIVLCDDLGIGDVQCFNPEMGKIPTPKIDQLASRGMSFTDAHSGSSVCTPTRYGLLTGRYCWRTSLQNGVVQGFGPNLISEDRPTLGGFLQTQGYHTAIIGKWHLNMKFLDPDDGTTELFGQEHKFTPPVGSRIPDGGWSAPNERNVSEDSPEAQLYDLNADFGEQQNLYTTNPDLAADLLNKLEHDIQNGRSTPGEQSGNDTDQIELWKSPRDDAKDR